MIRTARRMVGQRTGAGILALALAAIGLPAIVAPAGADVLPTPAPAQERSAETVSANSLPTVQLDSGVVWSQAVVGSTVYAGGVFARTRPAGAAAGQPTTPRQNLLAYNLKTGDLLPFNPEVNGAVKVVRASADGKRLYIGGAFSKVNGKDRWNIAAFDVATGQLLDSFRPAIGGSYVNALAVTATNVYVGGLFAQGNGVSRTNLAAFDLAGNLTGWAPTTNTQVDALVVAPKGDRVIAGGRFTTANGSAAACTAAFDPATGASLPWAVNRTITGGGGTGSGVMGLSTDGTYIYGAGWLQMSWYFEGVWAADPETGNLVWAADGQGDQYDVWAGQGGVYAVGHSHVAAPFGGWPDMKTPGGNYQYSLAMTTEAQGTLTAGGRVNLAGRPAPALIHWYPKWYNGTYTGMGQAGWSIEGNSDYVVVGGEFLGVNGDVQQGLARFARSAAAPSTEGPKLSAQPNNAANRWEAPTFARVTGGARITIRPNFDRDDRTLTYELRRSDAAEPVTSTTFASDQWLRTGQTVTLTDTSALPNTSYTYTVVAVDSDGNTAASSAVSGTTGDYPIPLTPRLNAAMSGLVGTFDGSGTQAPKNARLTAWDWDFGDGTKASGEATVKHTYATAGRYTVTLTVGDDKGSIGSVTSEITADPMIARDTFDRTGTTWGTAEVGGTWTTGKGATVADRTGKLTLTKAQTLEATLKNAKVQDADLTMGFSLEKASAGGGTFISAAVRRTDAGEYRTKVVVNADQTVSVYLTKVVGGNESYLASGVLPEVKLGAEAPMRIRLQAITGDDGTALRTRIWPAGQAEPSTWFLRANDNERALQDRGSVGLISYLSSASTIAPQTIRVHDFTVEAP